MGALADGEAAARASASGAGTAITRALRFFRWTLLGVLVGGVLALVTPLAFGGRAVAVLSGSMEPALHPGDAIVSLPIRPLDARPGDVVTFHDPRRGGALVTHRVRSLRVRGERVEVATKGDANNAVERWTIARDGTLGRAAYRVPLVGHVLVGVHRPAGWALFIALPLLLLAALELRDIWREPAPAPRRDAA